MVSGYGEMVYQFGLATRAEADFIIDKTKEAVKYIQNGDFEKAFAVSSKKVPNYNMHTLYIQTDRQI